MTNGDVILAATFTAMNDLLGVVVLVAAETPVAPPATTI
jgi:hypothetical protein